MTKQTTNQGQTPIKVPVPGLSVKKTYVEDGLSMSIPMSVTLRLECRALVSLKQKQALQYDVLQRLLVCYCVY